MSEDLVSEIPGALANVLQHQFIDVQTSAAKKSENIDCFVIPKTGDSASQFNEMVAGEPTHILAVLEGFPTEPDKSMRYPVLANSIVQWAPNSPQECLKYSQSRGDINWWPHKLSLATTRLPRYIDRYPYVQRCRILVKKESVSGRAIGGC